MNISLDYRNFRRDPVTNELSYINPDDLRRSGCYSAPKRAKGMGLTSEHKTWLWENWKYNSNMTFNIIARKFNIEFSDMKLKKVDLDMMKRYRTLGGEINGLGSYLNNKLLSTVTRS